MTQASDVIAEKKVCQIAVFSASNSESEKLYLQFADALKNQPFSAFKPNMRLRLSSGAQIDFLAISEPETARGRIFDLVFLSDNILGTEEFENAWGKYIAPAIVGRGGTAIILAQDGKTPDEKLTVVGSNILSVVELGDLAEICK